VFLSVYSYINETERAGTTVTWEGMYAFRISARHWLLCLKLHFILKIAAARFSETLVSYRITSRSHNTESIDLIFTALKTWDIEVFIFHLPV